MSSIHDWSKTAGDNDTADSAINWQENQFPSTVNNSARQMMGRVAELLDDLGAVTSTTNLTNAYSLTANSSFSALADGLIVGFKASATNTGAATLNVNAIGSKAIRRIGATADVAIEASTIVTGRKYLAVYDSAANSAAGAWVLLNPPPVAMTTAPTSGALGVASGNATLEVKGAGTGSDAAYMAFNRPASFAAYFGLDTDDKLKVGGGTFGAVDYEIFHEGNPEIPSGSRVPFYQAAAPTGWTKVTGIDNRALRVVDGTGGGTGGSVGFSTAFGRTGTDAHTLTTAEMPVHAHTGSTGLASNDHAHSFSGTTSGFTADHTHQVNQPSTPVSVANGSDKLVFNYEYTPVQSGTVSANHAHTYSGATSGINANHNHAVTINNAGSGGSHSHTMDMRVTYIDVIVCSRN